MATTFGDYYNSAMSRYAPQRKQEQGLANADLADKGLGNSTAAVGTMADIRAKYNALASDQANTQAARDQEWAENVKRDRNDRNYRNITFREGRRQFGMNFGEGRRQFDESLGENSRQFDRGEARAWYGDQNATELGKIAGGFYGDDPDKAKFANQPAWLAQMFADRFGKVGDGKGKVQAPRNLTEEEMRDNGLTIPSHYEDLDPGYASREADRQDDYLDLARAQARAAANAAAAEDKPADPWAAITAKAFENSTTDINPDVAGFQAGALPSKLLAGFIGSSDFGNIDVVSAARQGDPRAIAVMKLLYPETWMARIGDMGNPSPAQMLGPRQAPAAATAAVPQQGLAPGASRFSEALYDYANPAPDAQDSLARIGRGIGTAGQWLFGRRP